jgi:hypothetical protein
MQEKIISTIRIGVAAAVGSLTALLSTWGLLDPEIESSLVQLVEVVSFIVGSVAYYGIARLLEDRFPWLLGLPFPAKPTVIMRSNHE